MEKASPKVEGVGRNIAQTLLCEPLRQLIALVHAHTPDHGQSKAGQHEGDAKEDEIDASKHGNTIEWGQGWGQGWRLFQCYTFFSLMRVLWMTAMGSFVFSFTFSFLAETFLEGRIALLGTFVGLQLSYNSGFAFGMTFPEPWQTLVILVALVCVIWMGWQVRERLLQSGFGLIIGGALGNLFDRWGDALVTDYIHVKMFSTFNVADMCISIGFVLLFLTSFCGAERKGT